MPPKNQCGNPLFLSWMEELRDAAKEKGSKSAETFGKACKSLQACPVSYARPRDLVCLQGIGPKIVSTLERRFLMHCQDNGLPLPGSPAKQKGKARGAAPDEPDDDSVSNPPTPPPTKKRKDSAPKARKTYIPQCGSGGYGILLALVLAIDDPTRNTQVLLTRGEVVRGGQPYCDASYDHSEKGSYVTAWSSMKTLVNKGYVYVTGNPHKYCLTEEGYEVACAIRALRPEFAHVEKHPFLHETEPDIPRAGPSTIRAPSQIARPSTGASLEGSTNIVKDSGWRPEKFEFWYIDSAGSRVSSLSAAMIRLDPNEYINLRKIEFRAAQQSHLFAKQLKLVDTEPKVRDDSGMPSLFGFIVEEGAPPKCSKFWDAPSGEAGVVTRGEAPGALRDKLLRRQSPSELIILDDEGEVDLGTTSSPVRPGRAPTSTVSTEVSADFSFSRIHSVPLTTGSSRSTDVRNLIAEASVRGAGLASAEQPSTQSASADFSHPNRPSRTAPRLSSHIPALNPLADPLEHLEDAANFPDFSPDQAIIFPRGSYEILLIVDTREVESKTNRDKIAEALKAKGVKVETRALRLGDMCWVARRLDGLGGEEDECVLDYVVERKRLDDLCMSIKDGRYTEQCFRLSNSCIKHVYYIVEDWQVSERMAYDGSQIMTAKSQIQVHNRFFLKETHKLSETIDFLAIMTEVIVEQHREFDLRVIPTRYLSRSSYGTLQAHLARTRPGERYLTSFQAYQDLNDKNASKTLRERFARMLLCVKGMSAERVSAVLDVWETPKGMWEGLKRTLGEEVGVEVEQGGSLEQGKEKKRKVRGPEVFFADMVKGEGRRKIGDALSRDLYRALMGNEVPA